jgi:hypothetical protein
MMIWKSFEPVLIIPDIDRFGYEWSEMVLIVLDRRLKSLNIFSPVVAGCLL